ncbi:HNH endonuclease signature motif containing protein [Streptomyces sp. NPDC047939]|uniref:HNH endonuclease signature motif containing protein n=1 Tax=Streptomyces sp. NPDC047939 TaxID=3155381 RepID=UPI0034363362
MSKPKPLTEWQERTTPAELPRHIRRNIAPGENGCWLWTRSRSRDGYGWASLNDRTYQAHRLLYVLLKGEPKEGLVLDHLCRVRHCVNPSHLEPVTPRQNLERGNTPTGATHCKKGHALTPYYGQRRCVPCKNDYESQHRETKRQYARDYRARKKEQIA